MRGGLERLEMVFFFESVGIGLCGETSMNGVKGGEGGFGCRGFRVEVFFFKKKGEGGFRGGSLISGPTYSFSGT